MFEKIKKFCKDNKAAIIMSVIGGSVAIGTWAYWIHSLNQRNVSVAQSVPDLPIPDWGSHYDIQEHWKVCGDEGCVMVLDTFLPYLGDFGEKMIENFANPDIPVNIIMTYGDN